MLKVEADKLDDIPEAARSFYEEKDGKFRLKVDGMPDVEGLKKSRDDVLAELKSFKAKAREAEESAAKAAQDALEKSGNVDALRKSYEDKLAKREAELAGKISQYEANINGLTVGQTATSLAAALAIPGSADVLLPHIRQRLSVEYRDGQPVTVVLDASGKPSAMTVEELKAEFLANTAFAPIIAGSRASGGGASGGGRSGGATAKSVSRTVFDGMSVNDKHAHLKSGGTITG